MISRDFDSDLMLRPSRFGGTGIRDPIKTAASAYKTFFEASTVLKDAIMLDTPFLIDLNLNFLYSAQLQHLKLHRT